MELQLTDLGVGTSLKDLPVSHREPVHPLTVTSSPGRMLSTSASGGAAVGENGADPAVADNAKFDVNVDGNINLIDMALVKSLNGNSAS